MFLLKVRSVGIIALSVALLHPPGSTSCATSNARAEKIHRLASSLHAAGEFDGVVLVAQEGRVIYEEAFGIADVEKGMKNTIDTVFDLASITKPFTALAVMMLSEEGKVDLHAPVKKYLPLFPYQNVTIEHLLTHTSGLPNYVHNPQFLSFLERSKKRVGASEDLLGWLSMEKPSLDFEPGAKRRYSNSGYVVLGIIVDTVSGMTWEEFLGARIFSPLLMKRTYTWKSYEKVPASRWSRGHERSLDRTAREPYDPSGHSALLAGIRGANGVFSTAGDLLRLDQALYGETLISKETLAKAFQRFKLTNGKEEPYGYGWIIRSKPGDPKIVWHGGKGEGYLTSFHRDLEPRNTVIVLSNSSAHHLTIDEFSGAILDILHDREFTQPRIPISHPVATKLFTENGKAAVALYRRLRESAGADYIFDEDELNLLGYRLMWGGRLEDGIAILELNAEEYGESANVHDSLGDAYREAGDTQRAIACYRRALSLDADLSNTRRKLDGLVGSPEK